MHSLLPMKSLVAALLIFIAGCMVSYQIAILQFRTGIAAERNRVSLQIDHVHGNISREFYAAVNLTQGVVALVRSQGGISREQFSAVASELTSNNPLIRNIALAPGNVVSYICPVEGNEKSLGLDYMKTPDQRDAIVRGITERRMVIAGPLNLVQGGTGVIGRTPIFLHDANSNDGKDIYWGMASTVISFDSLMHVAGINSLNESLKIALRGIDDSGAQGEVFFGDSSVFAKDPVLMSIPLPEGRWLLSAVPIDGWMRFNPAGSASFLVGLVLTLFFSVLFFFTLRISHGRAVELKHRLTIESMLEKRNRALRLFSECNSAVVHSTDEMELLSRICHIAVESTNYRVAWIGRVEHDAASTVKPVAYAGPGEILSQVTVSWADNEYGQGVVGRAVRTRKPCSAQNLLNNPSFAPWYEAFVSYDIVSTIGIPLIVNDAIFGVLAVYAEESDAFDSTETDLLEELGTNIAHGIMALRSQKERNGAMTALERAHSELEERVLLRTRELLLAKEAAEAADRIKSAFLATMSHELRTPLNSIIGFTGIILQGLVGGITDEQRKQLTMVRDSAQHLLALINDVLDISKIESGQLELHREVFDVRDAITRSLQVIRPPAMKKHLDVNAPVLPDIITINSDRRRIEQILINLLGNAVKFTEVGSVTVTVCINAAPPETPPCAMNGMVERRWLQIAIFDTGIGIDAKDLDKLFTPFRQLDSGTTRRYEGTGLGLSICKKLACMLGGDIKVCSDGAGKGSTFTLFLPLAEETNG